MLAKRKEERRPRLPPPIISCSQWEAQAPRSRDPLRTLVPYVIIHHRAGNRCTSQDSCSREVRGIQSYHMDKRAGLTSATKPAKTTVYEGRGWRTRGAHAKNWNDKSLGTSFLGSISNTWVPSVQISLLGPQGNGAAGVLQKQPDIIPTAAKSLIQCAVSGGFLSETYTLKGHCDVKSTECPRNALYEAISQWPEFEA
ncbi:peptidoglycan-recognition protein SC2-like [Dermochelys coriacea]|uniref:peptidoglycan-recognition protein SC2-like n=1 Tax=Dermochelys coriacea TaxID=27794 RepID=UPI001CA9E939|nr:peptidoglycan-recognition protein SC2-like [Dermochelys coriacea]